MRAAPNAEVRANFAAPGPLTALSAYSSRPHELPAAITPVEGESPCRRRRNAILR